MIELTELVGWAVGIAAGFLGVPTLCSFLGGSSEPDALPRPGARRGELTARLAGTSGVLELDELATGPDEEEGSVCDADFGTSTKMGAVGGCLTFGS